MAGTHRAPTPQFFISDEDKEAMVGQLVAQTIFIMERKASIPNAPLADDFQDILARAAAAMIAADTNLKTPGKLRAGAETVAAHVYRHIQRYRAEEKETGHVTIHRMLEENPIPEVMRKSWEDS